jgi:flagellar hook-length control protein FliK
MEIATNPSPSFRACLLLQYQRNQNHNQNHNQNQNQNKQNQDHLVLKSRDLDAESAPFTASCERTRSE